MSRSASVPRATGAGSRRRPRSRCPSPALDSHTHLDIVLGERPAGDEHGEWAADDDVDAEIAAAAAVNVTRLVQVGVDVPSSRWSAQLAARHPTCWPPSRCTRTRPAPGRRPTTPWPRSTGSRRCRGCGRWGRPASTGTAPARRAGRPRRRPSARTSGSPRSTASRWSSTTGTPTTRSSGARRRGRARAHRLPLLLRRRRLREGLRRARASCSPSPARSPSATRATCARPRRCTPVDQLLVETDAPFLTPDAAPGPAQRLPPGAAHRPRPRRGHRHGPRRALRRPRRERGTSLRHAGSGAPRRPHPRGPGASRHATGRPGATIGHRGSPHRRHPLHRRARARGPAGPGLVAGRRPSRCRRRFGRAGRADPRGHAALQRQAQHGRRLRRLGLLLGIAGVIASVVLFAEASVFLWVPVLAVGLLAGVLLAEVTRPRPRWKTAVPPRRPRQGEQISALAGLDDAGCRRRRARRRRSPSGGTASSRTASPWAALLVPLVAWLLAETALLRALLRPLPAQGADLPVDEALRTWTAHLVTAAASVLALLPLGTLLLIAGIDPDRVSEGFDLLPVTLVAAGSPRWRPASRWPASCSPGCGRCARTRGRSPADGGGRGTRPPRDARSDPSSVTSVTGTASLSQASQ